MKVCVIGGGPVALYAAFRLVKKGHTVVLFERAAGVGGNVRLWSFVKLFSKLELNLPRDVKEELENAGHSLPSDEEYLSGADFVSTVLEPLAGWLTASGQCDVMTGWEVVSIGRGRLLKTDAIMAAGDKRRRVMQFRVLLRESLRENAGAERTETYDAVVDASGNYDRRTANRVGIGGISAPGERAAEEHGLIHRTIPDVKGSDGALVAGKRVGVIGTGYSAITCLRNLCDLANAGGSEAPSAVIWLTRSPKDQMPYSILENDPLPQRSDLAKFGNLLAGFQAADAQVPFGQTSFEYVPAMACTGIEQVGTESGRAMRLQLEIESDGQSQEHSVQLDTLFSLTGYHPDRELWSEIQVHTCYASDGPMKLAASLLAARLAAEGGGASGDCLKQAAPGAETLENPEPNFYILGMKSYGRNSTFLMRVGYEQVGLMVEKLGAANL